MKENIELFHQVEKFMRILKSGQIAIFCKTLQDNFENIKTYLKNYTKFVQPAI